MSAFHSSLFSDRIDSEEVTENISEGPSSREEYLRQRNRTIRYMLKHDFTPDEIKEVYNLSDVNFNDILNLT